MADLHRYVVEIYAYYQDGTFASSRLHTITAFTAADAITQITTNKPNIKVARIAPLPDYITPINPNNQEFLKMELDKDGYT